jgi:hypothetical protein
MNRGLSASLLAALWLAAATARAVEVQEPVVAHVAITVPDTWKVGTEGAWALAESPDKTAKVRVASYVRGILADLAAESFLIDLIADTWATYTVDKHVRRVSCGRYNGLEIQGHGAGDSWDRASFHLFLLIDPQNAQKGALVLLTGRSGAWDAAHPPLERAVHAIHPSS